MRKRSAAQRSTVDYALLNRVLVTIGAPAAPIYAPSDDSFLMIDVLASHPLSGRKTLDMGTGSGVLALYCAMLGADVTASDVDETALSQAKQRADTLGVQVKFCLSDLFCEIHDSFDFILFNPPYLPSLELVDRSVDGGPGGTVLIEKFLEELPSHLQHEGEALLLLSSVNDSAAIQLKHPNLEFATEAKKALFFEELQVLRIRPRDDLTV